MGDIPSYASMGAGHGSMSDPGSGSIKNIGSVSKSTLEFNDSFWLFQVI